MLENTPNNTKFLEGGLVDRYLRNKPEWINSTALSVSGSYYNGQFKPGSDVDLMRIVNGLTNMQRTNDMFEGVEVNTYSLSIEMLARDAQNAEYGYFYINRFLIPHHFLIDSGGFQDRVNMLVAEFLDAYCFPDIFPEQESLALDGVVARVYLQHLNDFPSLVVALQKACAGNDLSRLRAHFKTFLAKSKLVRQVGDRYEYSSQTNFASRALYHERIRLLRWKAWSETAKDGPSLALPLRYIDKQITALLKSEKEIEEFLRFLSNTARTI
jgi:hypothetical protein